METRVPSTATVIGTDVEIEIGVDTTDSSELYTFSFGPARPAVPVSPGAEVPAAHIAVGGDALQQHHKTDEEGEVELEVDVEPSSEGLLEYPTMEVELDLRGFLHLRTRGPAVYVVIVIAVAVLGLLRVTGHLG